MKLGLVVPSFREDPAAPLAAARAAEDAGLDGVFVLDHLWPIGRPGGPALSAFPLLGAIAAETSTIRIGTLVARVGLVPDAVLVHQLRTLDDVSGGRLVAGVGAGDRLSAPENEAFGVPVAPAAERLAAVEQVAGELLAGGTEVWVGGRSPGVREICRRTGATLNVWSATSDELANEAADVEPAPTTWGGMVAMAEGDDVAVASIADRGDRAEVLAGSPPTVASGLRALRDAGATWAVLAPVGGADDERAIASVAALRQLV